MEMLVEGPGLVLASLRFRIDGTNSPDRVVDGVPNTVQTTVTYEDVGKTFTVTLPKMGGGYPQEMLACVCDVAYIDASDAGVDETNKVAYVVDSYDRTTGAFTLASTISSGDPYVTVVGAPNDNSEIHVIMMLRKSAALAQTI
jgi:hypothetical protein